MNRVQYIFVSSTFSDFHYERDFLNRAVLPKLNERLKPYGYEVCFLDFRWGINDERYDADSKYFHIINTCITEVKNSKPFFLLFLGDNNGTMIDKKLVETIYKFNNINVNPENKSITQIEVDASPIFEGDNSRTFILKRRINAIAESQKSNYLKCNTDEYAAMLKEKLVHPSNYFEYESAVDESGRVYFDQKLLTDYIVNAIVGQFKKKKIRQDLKNVYEQEKDLFSLMIQENDKIFEGRTSEFSELEKLMSLTKLIKISGESGIGKTSFMCDIANKLKSETTFYYFVADAIGNSDVFSLLNYFIVNLGYKELRTTDLNKLKNYFYDCLNEINKDKSYIFIVDALDKLETYGKTTIDELFDFQRIPKNVRFIVSGINLSNSDISLKGFKKNEIEKVITKKTSCYKKVLPDSFFELFANLNNVKVKNLSNPLLLSLAIDSILFISGEDFTRIDTSNYQVSLSNILLEKINQIKDTPKEEFLSRFELIKNETEFGMRYLNLLACSKGGLTLREIQRICKAANIGFNQYEFELIRNCFYSQISLQKNGRYKLSHDLFRKTILSTMNKEEIESFRCALMLNVLLVDEDNASEFVSQLFQTEDKYTFMIGTIHIVNNYKKLKDFYDLLIYYFKNEICKKGPTQDLLFNVLDCLKETESSALVTLLFHAKSDEELYNVYPALLSVKEQLSITLDRRNKTRNAFFKLMLAQSSLLHEQYDEALKYATEGSLYIRENGIGNLNLANDFRKILFRSCAELYFDTKFKEYLEAFFEHFTVTNTDTLETNTYDELAKKEPGYGSIILDLFVHLIVDLRIGGQNFNEMYELIYPHLDSLYNSIKTYKATNDTKEMLAVAAILKLFAGAIYKPELIELERTALLKDYDENCLFITKEIYKIFEVIFLSSGLYFTSQERLNRNMERMIDVIEYQLNTNNFFSVTKIIGNTFANFSLLYLEDNKVIFNAQSILERLQSSLNISTDNLAVYYTLIKVSAALLFYGYYLNNKSLINKNEKIILSTMEFFKDKKINYSIEVQNIRNLLRTLSIRKDKDDFIDASNKFNSFLDTIK